MTAEKLLYLLITFTQQKEKAMKKRSQSSAGSFLKLTYENQMEFKRWARAARGLDKTKYYFDFVQAVDAKTDKDIQEVQADGSLSWDEAATKLLAALA